MNELSSTEFRKRFARLDREVLVTVNGHVIGRWKPIGLAEEVRLAQNPAVLAESQRIERAWRRSRPAPKR